MHAALFATICLGLTAFGLALGLRAPRHPPGATYALLALAILIALAALVTVLGLPLAIPEDLISKGH